MVRHSDYGHILDSHIGAQEVLNLDRVDILSAGDDDIFFAIHQEVKAVLVLLGHIAGVEPLPVEHGGGGLGVVVVAPHDAGTLDTKLTHRPGLNFGAAILLHNLALPSVAGNANGAHLVDVLHAQMDTAGTGGFGKAIVGVVFMVGEIGQPALNQGRRHRLRANMHESPLGGFIVGELEVTPIQRVQQVLGPGHQQPDNGAFLLRHSLQNRFGRSALQQHRLGAGNQRAKPVHFGPGMVQRWDQQETVVTAGLVMLLLHPGRLHQAFVVM